MLGAVKKILFGTLVIVVAFAASAFGMYKYNQVRTFKNLADQGRQCMLQKNYDRSVELFSEALSYKSDPGIKKDLVLSKSLKEENEKQKQISQNIQLSNSAIKNYDYNSANKYLDKALKLDPDNQEAVNLKNMIVKVSQAEREKSLINNLKKNNYKAPVKEQKSQKQVNEEITYKKALQIVANKYPESSFQPVQEVVPLNTLKKFLTDDQLKRYYIFYGHYVPDGTDFQDLILVDKKTGHISQLSPDGVIH